MSGPHSIGPKHGHENTKQTTETTDAENLQFRALVGRSEVVGYTLRPMIPAATTDKADSKKRKFDVRSGGGREDKATGAINKTSRVSGEIMDKVSSLSPTLVIHAKRAKHMK